jgi:hypothetical protein
VASYQGRVAALDVRTGRKLWQRNISSFYGVSQGFGNVYVAEESGTITAYLRNGQGIRWQQEALAWRGLSRPVPVSSYLAVADFEGYLHLLSQVDGEFLAACPGQGWRARRHDRRRHVLYVYTNSGKLIAYDLARGTDAHAAGYALVGRPNVGKSTLFNQLTRSAAMRWSPICRPHPRSQVRRGTQCGGAFIVIDTGGVTGDEEGIDAAMAEQSLQAMDEADVVLLLVDARDGLTAVDEQLVRDLRQRGRPSTWSSTRSTAGTRTRQQRVSRPGRPRRCTSPLPRRRGAACGR